MLNRKGCEKNVRLCTSPDAHEIETTPNSSGELLDQAQAGAVRLGITWDDGKHYTMALAKWTVAGWPTRDQAEVERIYRDCCNPCDDNTNGRCKLCGCRVNLGIALRNKIRMATEDCPVGKWSPQLLPTMIGVVGPNRSGTSCVAGILHKLGVSMGREFIPPTKENPTGYYEEMQLHRYLHKNYYWQPPAESAFAQHAAWFRDYAAGRKESPVVGCKHPLLCFALKEMSQAWPRLKIVATVRSAEDSTASLKRVGWYAKRRIPMAEYSKVRDDAIKSLSLPAVYMPYHEVLRDPAAAVDRLVEFCGITPTADERMAAIAHVDPALCHVNPPANLERQLVDVVYPLSNGSTWQDNELRYSLRSLDKFARNLGRVFVVGRKPAWLTGVVHIPARDNPMVNKDANIINKIRLAIAAGISERFIFASDDQFLAAPVDLATLPVTHEHASGKDKSRWWDRFYHTQKYLTDRGRPTLFYETHLFQPHTTQAFEQACVNADYETNPGYTVNSLVYNSTSGIANVPASRIRGGLMRGYNDDGLNDDLKKKLSKLFSQPSRFEMNSDNSDRPRVFSFWTGPMPNLIKLCFDSMKKNIPDIEIYDLDRWKSEYDGRLGPWEKIVCRKPNVQSDILRYWLLDTYGGIWLDADNIAFQDIRGAWDTGVGYIGYWEKPRVQMPYTAFMGAPLGSPIVDKQCELVRELVLNCWRIHWKAGPVLTRDAILACADTPIRMYPRDVIHPVVWSWWLRHPNARIIPGYNFNPNAYGMMLMGKVIRSFNGASEDQLMNEKSVVGHALRKALA